MAELADALDSGSSESDLIQVQVLLPAPYRVFIMELSYGHSIFLQFRVSCVCYGAGFEACFLSFYVGDLDNIQKNVTHHYRNMSSYV